jgi:folate-dependent phosphoribosylglycinamide formyltransferase PurN
MSDVVILSPSRFSLNTLCATELLLRNQVQVKAIVVRRLINPRRFVKEFGRDGTRLIRKIWKKLVLRDSAYKHRDYETIVDFMKAEGMVFRTVDELAKKHGIPVVYCYDLNVPVVVDTLKKAAPDLVVFTGGGLIRAEVLQHCGAGIANCHMGILPRYRGMDVVEWPVLEDRLDQVGTTVHFMDQGIDTGDILQKRKVSTQSVATFKELRDRFERCMCEQFVETCLDYLNGRVERVPQAPEDGKQYFLMHPRLLQIAQAKLKAAAE